MDNVQVQQDQLSEANPKIWNDILGWNQEQLDDLRLVGYSYLKEGKYEVALPIFESLAILLPASVYDLQTLGALYLEMGKNIQALQAIDHRKAQRPFSVESAISGRYELQLPVLEILQASRLLEAGRLQQCQI